MLYGPVNSNTLWSGFGGGCETNNDGDATVKYDRAADRWVISQFSVTTTPYLQCVAVSTTGDPTGSYYRYAFDYGPAQFPDYPKLGVWPDAYYTTYNIFTNGATFAGAKVCAFDRTSMLTGAPATQQCFDTDATHGGLLPSDLDGPTPPPAGSPNYVLEFATNSLNMWRFHVDWATPANTTFGGPINIPVAAFSAACSGGGTCIPQPGTNNRLDSLADRLMYRLAYRNFGDHESLVVNHSVTASASVGVRWYEIRNPGGTPTVYQQSTYAPDATYRWMGSIAMDASGDIAMGYSASSGSLRPSIRYTGRLATDPLNTMQAEATLITGTGVQTGALHRWGDYSSMSVDPVDDCTFWYTNEYLAGERHLQLAHADRVVPVPELQWRSAASSPAGRVLDRNQPLEPDDPRRRRRHDVHGLDAGSGEPTVQHHALVVGSSGRDHGVVQPEYDPRRRVVHTHAALRRHAR